MGKKIDMTGKRFGRLVVVFELEKRDKQGNVFYFCKCDCGATKEIAGRNLRSGETTSCGCYQKEASKRFRVPGGSLCSLHGIWRSMIRRCNDSSDKAYHNYGGRGITVGNEWVNSYEQFYKWAMSNGYKKGLTIDRIDNDGNYSEQNCRWVSMKIQQNNKRDNKIIEYQGKEYTQSLLAEKLKIAKGTLSRRIQLGWDSNDYGKPVDKTLSHSEAIKKAIHRNDHISTPPPTQTSTTSDCRA